MNSDNYIDIFKLNDMDNYIEYLLKPVQNILNQIINKHYSIEDLVQQKEKIVKNPEIMNLHLVEIFYKLYKKANKEILTLPVFHTQSIEVIIDYYIKKIIINQEPFFIINLSDIQHKYNQWKILFPMIKPHFAVKSNPDKKIISLLLSLGCNFDCASIDEIRRVLKLGGQPSQIIYANPVKSIEYLLFAKEHNIDLMTFDSIEELYKIKKYYNHAKIILRIKTNDIHSSSKLSFKFGMEINEVENAIDICLKLDLNLVGVSFHVGSNSVDVNAYITALEDCRNIFDMAYNKNILLHILDIGGGFTYETAVQYHNIINNKIDNLFLKNKKYKQITIISEPGRYFVETSHTLILNIIGKKLSSESNSGTIKYYLNDGIYGCLNNIERDNAKIIIKSLSIKNSSLKQSIFFGPTCDSYDTIANNILFPDSDVNDWLYINKMGAYTRAGSSKFNGFKSPIIYYYYDSLQ